MSGILERIFNTFIYSITRDPQFPAELDGKLSWNEDEDTLSILREDGGTREVGKEISDNYTNLDTVDILNGDIVSIVGASGNRSAVKLTDTNDDLLAQATIGMCTVDVITVNENGEITKDGKVHGLNTNVYNEGDTLWVDPNNNGKWTNIKPVTSKYAIKVGIVVVKHHVEGVVDLTITVYDKNNNIIIIPASTETYTYNLTNNKQTVITGTLPNGINSILVLPATISEERNEVILHFKTNAVASPTLVYSGFTPVWLNGSAISMKINKQYTIVFEQINGIVKTSWGEY